MTTRDLRSAVKYAQKTAGDWNAEAFGVSHNGESYVVVSHDGIEVSFVPVPSLSTKRNAVDWEPYGQRDGFEMQPHEWRLAARRIREMLEEAR